VRTLPLLEVFLSVDAASVPFGRDRKKPPAFRQAALEFFEEA